MMVDLDMDRITRCYDMGWHVDMAGPCFRDHAQAIAWRDRAPEEIERQRFRDRNMWRGF